MQTIITTSPIFVSVQSMALVFICSETADILYIYIEDLRFDHILSLHYGSL